MTASSTTPSRSNPLALARTARRPLVVLVAALVALAGLTTMSAPAKSETAPYPRYQPQTTCSPTPKRGTVYMAKWLQRTYRGTGSMGISRACSVGGRSEHKEGRAFDWAVNASVPSQAHKARSFLNYLRKRRGPADNVRARNMGVMYVIWNDRIYSSSDRYQARPYRNAACSSIRSCSKTLRHRDHMHISLTRGAAAGRSPWFRAHLG